MNKVFHFSSRGGVKRHNYKIRFISDDKIKVFSSQYCKNNHVVMQKCKKPVDRVSENVATFPQQHLTLNLVAYDIYFNLNSNSTKCIIVQWTRTT